MSQPHLAQKCDEITTVIDRLLHGDGLAHERQRMAESWESPSWQVMWGPRTDHCVRAEFGERYVYTIVTGEMVADALAMDAWLPVVIKRLDDRIPAQVNRRAVTWRVKVLERMW